MSPTSSRPSPDFSASAPLDRLPAPGDRRVAVRVSNEATRWIRSGHPWLFEDSITSTSAEGQPGDLAVVFDSKRRFQAIGLFDPESVIRVRILHHGEPMQISSSWWEQRLTEVVERRRSLLDSDGSTGLRCINGENDDLPGLVVDLYSHVAVVKLYTPAWLPHLRTIVPLIAGLLRADTVVLRLSRRTQREAPAGITDGMALLGQLPSEPVLFRENGLLVEADVVAGQKTGYFLDQRDNRRLVGARCRGARVLDVFSAGGGFSLAAAAGGATSVLSVDISGPALAAVERNFRHNEELTAVRRCRLETRRGDAFEIMAELAREGRQFDVVVVDPPSFAQSQTSVAAAIRAYARLTDLAVHLVEDGGLLFQASCSSRVTAQEFYDTVTVAATRAGVELDELGRTGHPIDHVSGFQYGEYLKALLVRVHRTDR
ncbi:MAG: class I SAM-dependent rRNA methyltransferase [Aquihabitans sp.]